MGSQFYLQIKIRVVQLESTHSCSIYISPLGGSITFYINLLNVTVEEDSGETKQLV